MILGCATAPEVIYLQPENCEPAPFPALPSVDAGVLYDLVGQDVYNILQDREKLIVDWALENEAVLKSLCEGE